MPHLRHFIAACALAFAPSAHAQLNVQPSSTNAAPATKPPAPAFKPGMSVLDRDGASIGTVESLYEGSTGPMIVLQIDGKLVSAPTATLTLDGERAISTLPKARLLLQADAPR